MYFFDILYFVCNMEEEGVKKLIVLVMMVVLCGCATNSKYEELLEKYEVLEKENAAYAEEIAQLQQSVEENEYLKGEIAAMEYQLQMHVVNFDNSLPSNIDSLDPDLPGIYLSEENICYIILDNGWFIAFYKDSENKTASLDGTWYIKDNKLIWGLATANEYTYQIEGDVLYLEDVNGSYVWRKMRVK